MKKILLLTLLIALSESTFAQLSGNLEFTNNRTTKTKALGASAQYLIYNNYYFLPGIKAGVLFDFGNEVGTTSYNVPIMGIARYYLIGRHSCCGGGYVEANGGVGIYHTSITTGEGETLNTIKTKETFPQASLGLGYRFPMSYDYSFRMLYVFDGGKATPFLGMRLGYTF